MSECNHDCSSCGADCASRTEASLLTPLNAHSRVKKVIAVVSGKGGVGKSLVTGLTAVLAQRNGLQTAILDGDVTGPSIPKMFGVRDPAMGSEEGILPAVSRTGIRMMSVNLLLENDTDPVVWRGSLISGTVKQFWTDVVWGDVDYMFVDMPPGTGDVPLTVFQSLPIDGVVIVTSPQDLVSMIVAKAVKMANMMHIPVLGFVENYSYLQCPDCGKKISVFGKSHIDEIAAQFNLPVLAKLPIDPTVAESFDNGLMETVDTDDMNGVIEAIKAL